MNLAAIVLCGGGSRRMGCDKLALDFHGEPMLLRVVRLLREAPAVGPIACVAAKNQLLPDLPHKVLLARDRQDDCGPLEGLATGLHATSDADAVFMTTCDAPLLVPALPNHLASMLGEFDAVVPRIEEQLYPLTAVYRPTVQTIADARLARGQRRVIDFVAELNARYVAVDELRAADPELLSLRNCNTMEEYRALLEFDAKTQRHRDTQS